MAGEKRTKIDQLEKEKLVYKWLMSGKSHKQITEELLANHGYRTAANCRKIIEKVVKSFVPESEQEIELLRAEYVQMYKNLFGISYENGEIKTAKSVLDSIVKLQGLAVTKIEAKVETTFEVNFE